MLPFVRLLRSARLPYSVRLPQSVRLVTSIPEGISINENVDATYFCICTSFGEDALNLSETASLYDFPYSGRNEEG